MDFDAGAVRVRQAVTEVPGQGLKIVKPKTAKSVRAVPLPPAVMAGLRRHAAKQATRAMRLGSAYARAADLVFGTWTGTLVSHRAVRAAYLRLCKAAGIVGARGPYDLRHTAATLLIDAGVPIKAVSERLGHANVAITLGVYVHTTPAQHDRATEVLGEFVQ